MAEELRRVRARRGTAQQWTTTNPVLGLGEFGVEVDTGLVKMGNGTDDWQTLDYFGKEGPPGPPGSGQWADGAPFIAARLTQAEFNQLDPPDADVVYFILPAT